MAQTMTQRFGERSNRRLRCSFPVCRSISTRFTLTSQSGVEMSVMIGSSHQAGRSGGSMEPARNSSREPASRVIV